MIYQPILKDEVSDKYYHYLDNAEKDFPNCKIAVFREESVKDPIFVDVVRTTIRVVHEPCPMNPFEDWDCCYPLLNDSGRGNYNDYSNGDIDRYLSSYLTASQLTRNMARLLDMMEYSGWSKDSLSGKALFDEEYPLGEYTGDERADELSDMLTEFIGESIKNKAVFCEEFGIKHYNSTSTGYSQSDWADVFTCWTPEFGKICGVAYEEVTIDALKSNFDLFSQWAWGDVYFYLVEEEESGEVLDSCGGFYGSDFLENGMMEYIMNEIEDKTEEEVREILSDIDAEY